jgi:peptidoglycan/xylan/chitin deacetylase (PgdA/CDA1 family)
LNLPHDLLAHFRVLTLGADRPGTVELVICGVLRWSGLATLVRKTLGRRRASILLYHDPEPQTLARHLAFLAKKGCTFVSLDALVRALRENAWHSVPNHAVVVTFDDGHRGNAQVVEILRRYGVRPTIYMCSQVVGSSRGFWFTGLDPVTREQLKCIHSDARRAALGRLGIDSERERLDAPAEALTTDDVQLMCEWVDFGSHTRFHPILTTCADPECEEEISKSKDEVSTLTGQPCAHFSYPNGDYTSREIAMVDHAGYSSARTIDVGWVGPRTDPLRLRIVGTPDNASVTRLAANLGGLAWIRAALVGRVSGRRRPITLEDA